MPFTSDAYMLPHPSDSILALCHYVIKLRVDGLVVPQDPAQSKQWGLCCTSHLSYLYRGSKMYLKSG